MDVLLEYRGSRRQITVSSGESITDCVTAELRRVGRTRASVFTAETNLGSNEERDVYLLQKWSPQWDCYVDIRHTNEVCDGDKLTVTAKPKPPSKLFNLLCCCCASQDSGVILSRKRGITKNEEIQALDYKFNSESETHSHISDWEALSLAPVEDKASDDAQYVRDESGRASWKMVPQNDYNTAGESSLGDRESPLADSPHVVVGSGNDSGVVVENRAIEVESVNDHKAGVQDENEQVEPAEQENNISTEDGVQEPLVEENKNNDQEVDNLVDDVPGEDVPSEDVPGEDVPADDVPADDVPSEDVPGEDVPADDVPADDVPSEDVPGEDVPADDVPGDDDVPAENVPSEDVPAENVPGEDVPGEDVHNETVPSESVPGEDVPGESVPGEDVPSEDVPSEYVPGEDVPSEDVPSEDVPGESVPGEDMPSEDVPSEDVPSEDVPSEDVPVNDDKPAADHHDDSDNVRLTEPQSSTEDSTTFEQN